MSSPCFADFTMTSDISIQGGGSLTILNASGTATTMVSGDRARTESKVESESRMVQAFARNANTATIVKMDDELIVNLVPEKRQYSEVTFEQMRASLERSMAEMEKAQQSGSLPVSEDECEWSEPVIDVNKTRNEEKFANIKARQTLITASQSCTDHSTGNQCNMTWNLEYWSARKMPAKKEMEALTEAMSEALGGEDQLGLARLQTSGMMGLFKKGWDQVLSESGDIRGYPVKTVMTLEMGGENCKMQSGQPIAMDDAWAEASDLAMNAAAGTAAAQAGSAIGQGAANAMGNSIGGSIAGSAVGAASKSLIGGALSKFTKRKDKKEEATEAEAGDSAPTDVILFTISSELVSFDERKLAASNFEVPDGWTRVEPAIW